MGIFVCLDPLDATLPLALLRHMVTENTNEGGNDVRGLVLPGNTTRARMIAGALEQVLFRSWYQNKYSIPGHPFKSVTTYTAATVDPPQLTATRLDSDGDFRL